MLNDMPSLVHTTDPSQQSLIRYMQEQTQIIASELANPVGSDTSFLRMHAECLLQLAHALEIESRQQPSEPPAPLSLKMDHHWSPFATPA